MGIKLNRKQLAVAAIALAGLAGGAVAAHATTFTDSVGETTAPAVWPSIAPTCSVNPCDIDLDVGTGIVTIADVVNGPTDVPYLGFGVNGAPASLAGSPNSTIKVPVGTTLNITLTQTGGSDAIDLSFPSLPAGDVVDNGGGSYTVEASTVGTSVFQPGSNPGAPKQIASGLVGVLIVTPVGCVDTNRMCAYDSNSYEDEALVAITDLDFEYACSTDSAVASLCAVASGNGFEMSYFGQSIDPDFSPRQVYHLINGKAFPDTDVIEVRAADTVLLRYVNAGVSDRTMGLLGLRQTLIARNTSVYDDPQTFIAPLIGPGETADVAVVIPEGAFNGQLFSLMDQGQQMNNGTDTGFGGALTFLNVRESSAPIVNIQAAIAGLSAPPSDPPPSVSDAIGGIDVVVNNSSTPLQGPADPDALGGIGNPTQPVPTIVTPSGSTTLSATGHSSVASQSITGFQTVVNSGSVPDEADWSAPLPVVPAPTVPIVATVSAVPGQTIWVRVQQHTTIWSSPASIVVPDP
jgi:hypothetical protein